MSLRDNLEAAYGWAVLQREAILIGCAMVPIVGAVLARIGKAGRTDADGRFIASTVVSVGISAFLIEVIAAVVATGLFGRSLLDADALLLCGPMLCLAGCLIGIRWVFPLNQLASVRTTVDVGAFVAACIGVLWLFSKFRGWGILFLGSVGQIATIGLLLWALLKRLHRRAFGSQPARV
jgi:hypothetical protein